MQMNWLYSLQNLSHFYFELSITKTVQPVAKKLVSAAVNDSVFSCLEAAGRIHAPAKDSALLWRTKIEHVLL